LTIELAAINQYFCQAKMCKNWGYLKLGKKHYEESLGEMKHADKLIDRIIFLEGVPEIARYDVIRVGTDVKEQFEYDLALEMKGVTLQRPDRTVHPAQGWWHARPDRADPPKSEEHVDWLETQLDLIKAVGIQNYLTEQMDGDGDE
jgi:bacterioferritin